MTTWRILVLAGPDAGRELPLGTTPVVAGRGSCDLALSDGSVSRRHLEISLVKGSPRVRDLGSSNGTFVDGRRVPEADLAPGIIVTLGATDLTVTAEADEGGRPSGGPAPRTTLMVAGGSAADLLGVGDRARRDLTAVFETARGLHDAPSVGALADRLVQTLMRHLPAAAGVVLLRDGDGRFTPVASRDEGEPPPPPSRALLTEVCDSLETRLVADPDGRPACCLPLPAPEGPVGAVHLRGRAGLVWGPSDLALAAALGEIAGPALSTFLLRLRLADEGARMRHTLREAAGIVGSGRLMSAVLDAVSRLAVSPSPVLVLGETGTGKELVARALHYRGPRAGGPFVAVNCAAMTSEQGLSDLFGHERGAFTGAAERRRGRFELAHGGTLFLDEVGDLAPEHQAALLRVLETGTLQRVGGTLAVDVDVRLVAATNRDLRQAAEDGLFRRDLWFRLAAAVVTLPPLRERDDDLTVLVEHFLARAAAEAGRPRTPRLTAGAWKLLRDHPWPGNVRELRNLTERLAVLAEGDLVDEAAVGALLRPPAPPLRAGGEAAGAPPPSLAEVEAEHIRRVMAFTEGNKTKAAEILGVERATLYARMRRHGIGD